MVFNFRPIFFEFFGKRGLRVQPMNNWYNDFESRVKQTIHSSQIRERSLNIDSKRSIQSGHDQVGWVYVD
jgi:hypothetical protein